MNSGFLRRWAFASACVLSLTGAAAGAARAETLAEAVELAYRTNPSIQAQRASLRALDENYVQARSGFGLNVAVQGQRTEYMLERYVAGTGKIEPSPPSDSQTTSNTASLSVQQNLYSGGRVSARTNAASADIEAGRQQLRRAELDLMVRVVNAYVGVRRDEQVLKISRDMVKVLSDQLSDTGAKFDVRQVTATDQAQSRARLAQARTQLANAEAQLNASRAAYNALVGRNPGSLEPEPQLGGIPQNVDAAFEAAEARAPQLLQAQYTEQASRARISEARAQRRPQLSLRATAQRNPYLPYDNRFNDQSLSLSAVVSQPLFTGGAITSQIRQAVEQNNRDRLLVEDARRTTIQNIAQGWEQLAAARNALVSQQEEAQADETAFYGVREEEKVGLRSTIEILNAAQELSQAQLALARGRATEYVSRVQLLAIMGTLTIDDLSPGAVTYDPETHFDKVKNKGSLPWEAGIRALDRLGGAPIGQPRPAATEPAGHPEINSELPATPAPAAEVKPSVSIVSIMDSTRMIPADATGPVSTNRGAERTPIAPPAGVQVPLPGAPSTAAPPLAPPPQPAPVQPPPSIAPINTPPPLGPVGR